MQIAFHIDVGPRENLEDHVVALTVYFPPPIGPVTFLLVCDGVGGNACGEVASALAALRIIAHLMARFDECARCKPTTDHIATWLNEAFADANEAILRQADCDATFLGMATTAVCGVIANDVVHVAWVGDSRAYVCNAGRIVPLTRDHSEVRDLIEAGVIDADQAHNHPAAHRINRCLGDPHRATPEITTRPLRPGDVLVLVTDGLTDVVTDNEIARSVEEHVSRNGSFHRLPHSLVQQALESGTYDNVTVLCCAAADSNQWPRPGSDQTRTDGHLNRRAQVLSQLHKEKMNVDQTIDCVCAG